MGEKKIIWIVRTRRDDEEEEEMNLDVNVLMKRQTTIEKEQKID